MNPPPKELDVRPILKNGGEPFQAIMDAVDGLKPGEALRLFATFRPQPLFKVMANRGFDHEAREIAGGDWEVLFTPRETAAPVALSSDALDVEAWPDPVEHLNLTELDPPEPMVRILDAAERLESGDVLFALLSREPVFLFPELASRGHQWAGNFDETGTVFRIFVRVGKEKGLGK
ncbi:DUF2249 domain-containing protein [Mesorhizobium plurifarium]|uniref:DUF2249 domain-containing protein n=1 Tax=Sinorhizobium arboris TaxID=76745 RepID=UPI000427ED5A|nr:DUF2249 domain-containing protein [Sinorhizobium arboris]PST20623.1 DUF2249 domain-containing protein [Mesorhizobium plurifarium]